MLAVLLLYVKKKLVNAGVAKIDYFEIRDSDTLNLNERSLCPRLFVSLYIDEIRITPDGEGGSFGIIEIPIPPGSRVEKQYLNLNVSEFETSSFRHKVIFDQGNLYYSIPIESLDKPVILRSYVRFSQRGEFILPRARFYKMYSPNDKAFADENNPQYKKILVN